MYSGDAISVTRHWKTPTTIIVKKNSQGPDYWPRLVRVALAEFLGTWISVFFGAAAVASIEGLELVGFTPTGAALASLFTDFVVISTFTPISGGYFNPAISLGFWILRRIDTLTLLVHWAMQIAGSFAGAGLLVFLLGGTATGIGAPVLEIVLDKQITWWAAFVVLMLLAAASFIVIMYNRSLGFSPYPALAEGSFTGAVDLAVSSVLGIGPNPARWLGPAVIANVYGNWWVWVFPPFIGVVCGGIPIYLLDAWLRYHQRRILKRSQEEEKRRAPKRPTSVPFGRGGSVQDN